MKQIIIILFSFLSTLSHSSHIVGGDIYYDDLGGNNYRFTVAVYRDCLSTGAAFDSPLNLAVYTSNGMLIQNVTATFPGSNVLPVVFNNPCVTPPTNICTEVAIYTAIINLPPIVGGYNVTYQRCCRGPNITNLVNPDDTGLSLLVHVPGLDTGAFNNSSPRFNNYPPLLLCNNEDLVFDHSATDPDGDQLSYSLVAPYSGASSFNPLPVPASAAPYPPVQWGGGFSSANPLGPGASINIHPTTGLLTASPNLTGLFVVGIQVEERRNGVLINKTIRDFLFRVFNCNLQLESILPVQEDLPDFVSYCQGLTVNFVNNSYGGTNYGWDFGVPGTNTDVSSAFAPSFTYPSAGIYTAMLVVNPGWPCTDTAFMTVNINLDLDVSWSSQDSLCIFGNSFDFVGSAIGPAGVVYNWEFGSNASQNTATGQIVNGITFDKTGFIPVTVHGDVGVCNDSYTDSIYIFPEPIADFDTPPNIECLGFDIQFSSESQNASIYKWDFGVSGISTDVSTLQNPNYVFPGTGTYDVTFIAGSTPFCMDTIKKSISLYQLLEVDFTSEDSMCVTNNSFNFNGVVSGPAAANYEWNFGPDASVNNVSSINVNGVSFNTTGPVNVTLTGSHLSCSEEVTHTIYLYSEPTINFSLADGLQCVPFNAQFTDLSTAETGILYQWDFGDGNTSNLQNPSHVYTQVGSYPVTLNIATVSGCVANLSLLQPDIVDVHPNPTSDFTLSKYSTDICDSEIEFFDKSIGGYSYLYLFDDSTFISTEQNPIHLYYSDGTKYPMQIVTNEWGCKDSSFQKLYIEPFTIFAPNTFTPDGNEFNNTFNPKLYLDVYQWELTIYNRWGELLFTSNDINNGWDGVISNGLLAPSGTYIYKIKYVSCEPINPAKEITGHINLLR